MFRRPSKNPLDKESEAPDYEVEPSPFKYAEAAPTAPLKQRLYEAPAKTHNPETAPRWNDESWQGNKKAPLPHPFQGMEQEDEPETTLGEGVTFRGELKFDRLLRIDGTFEGELISEGKVVIGPTGTVKANLNLKSAIIEGSVEGNVTVEERLELRGNASIEGDIKAQSLTVDDGVSIMGLVEVAGALSPTTDDS